MRFFAAFSIVIYHAQAQFPFLLNLTKEFELEQAVSFFFVLSGFILTYAHKDLGLRNAKRYVVSRFWRIYPVHIFALATLFVLLPEHTQTLRDWQVALAYLTMTHAWIPIQKFYFAWNSPSWSISAEWFFYICLPALLVAGRRKAVLPIITTICSLIGACLFATLSKLPLYSMDGASGHGLLYVNPLARIFEFALGISIALIRDKLPKTKLPTFPELMTLILMVLVCHISTKLSNQKTVQIPEHIILWASHGGLSAFSSALLVLVFQQERGSVSKLLQFKPLIVLGEASFAMYMLHYVFLCYKFECLPLSDTVADFILFLIVLITASYAVFSFIETPTRKLFRPAMKTEEKLETKVVMQNFARFITKVSLLVAIIYFAIPGIQSYQNELTGTIPINIESVDFDKKIELSAIHRSKNNIYFRFSARKSLLLFEKVEVQLLDQDLRSKMFLRQNLTARPEAVAAGKFFDLKVPIKDDIFEQSSFITLKLIRPNGKPLYPQNGSRDDNGTRLLVNLKKSFGTSR